MGRENFTKFDDSNVKVDRLPVIVSDKNKSQLLGVPKNKKATGKNIENSVVKLVKEWIEVEDKIKAMCYDTTNVNSGSKKGAAITIEHLLDKSL